MMKFKILSKILSFSEIPAWSEKSGKTVLLLRHSIRESIAAQAPEASASVHLTPEGIALAYRCGQLLAPLKSAAFKASPTTRTRETAEQLQLGGNLGNSPIEECKEISDIILFQDIETPKRLLLSNKVPEALHQYYSTGEAEGFYPLSQIAERIFRYLTETDFAASCNILLTHDLVIVSLLKGLNVYPFTLDDWCGFIQGAALFQDPEDGVWTVAYTVPDTDHREIARLFV